jgi:hypothetical protein
MAEVSDMRKPAEIALQHPSPNADTQRSTALLKRLPKSRPIAL